MSTSAPPSALGTPWGSVSLVFELGYIIALPAVAFGFGGAYLDRYLGVSPLCTVFGLLLAFVCSTAIVVRKVKTLTKIVSTVTPPTH